MASATSNNPVKAAFKLVQQFWGKSVKVTACDTKDRQVEFNFRYLEIIGNGTFGIVCRARDLDTNEIVAIKTVYQDEGHQNRELSIIKALSHPNIVSLKKYFYTRNENDEEFLSLVLEYVPTSLDRILRDFEKKQEPIPLVLIQLCMFQFMQALEYLHGRGICHRDIKPHNILVDMATGVVKLCDFGCSKRLQEGEPNIQYICARYYRAPEIVYGWAYYTTAIDVWSAGCVMAELFTGKPLFPGRGTVDQLGKIIKVLGQPTGDDLAAMGQDAKKAAKSSMSAPRTLQDFAELFPPGTPGEAIDLMNAVLRYNPRARPTPIQAMHHPFFTGLFSPQCKLPSGNPIPSLLDNTPLTQSNNSDASHHVAPSVIQPS